MQHIQDVWKIIEAGRKKYGLDWYGIGYNKADSFSKHFANLCRECNSYNKVRAKMKPIMKPSIVWKGDRILCMKSSRTWQCKICMMESAITITIMRQMDENKSMANNDNSDIYSSCKCGSQFHKFFQKFTTDTDNTFDAEKRQLKHKRATHQKKKRFSFFNAVNTPTIQTPIYQPCNKAKSTPSSSSEEPVSPQCVMPVFFYFTTTQHFTQTSQKPVLS